MHRHVNAIAGRLSLRYPQRRSLEILDRITEIAPPGKESDIGTALDTISSEFPSVTDFEREFPSVCFALATGVGKTRLMGAFISYLHLLNFDPKGMSAEEIEKLKLEDGVGLHEGVKVELETYARETGNMIVKPFLLVIARYRKTGLNSLGRYAALPSDGLTRLNKPTAPLELEYKFDFLFKRKRGQSAAMRLLCLD